MSVPTWEPHWYCTTHHRIADYYAGDVIIPRCDPKLGGIMMPCKVTYTFVKDTDVKAADGNEPTLGDVVGLHSAIIEERLRRIEDTSQRHEQVLISLQNEVNELTRRVAGVEPPPVIHGKHLE